MTENYGKLRRLTKILFKRLRQTRVKLILQLVNGESMILLIGETGDCKKGNSTDYVRRQYIGNVGKKENGIMAITAYELFKGMIVPLCFEVYKPKECLKAGEAYRTKSHIARTIRYWLLTTDPQTCPIAQRSM